MKLYLTLEDGDTKTEKTLMIDENSVTNHEKLGSEIEEMFDIIKETEDEVFWESQRLTVHND